MPKAADMSPNSRPGAVQGERFRCHMHVPIPRDK